MAEIRENIAVTQLNSVGQDRINELVFLASEPDSQSSYGYSSKKLSANVLINKITTDVLGKVDTKSIEKRIDILENSLCSYGICCDIDNPYVISSMFFENGRVEHLEGYRLSTYVSQMVSPQTDDLKKEIDGIKEKISTQATKDNQLADKDFVNSSIEHVAAFFITRKHQTDDKPYVFSTYEDLSSTPLDELYSGPSKRRPTRNDYCVVLSDETQSDSSGLPKTSRYIYDSNDVATEQNYEISCWQFQYVVNNAPFTDAQWKAINSAVTEISSITDNIYGEIKNNKITLSSNSINEIKNGTYTSITRIDNKISIDCNLPTETWTFTLDNGKQIEYDVVVTQKRESQQ